LVVVTDNGNELIFFSNIFLGYGDKINESKDIRDDKMLFYNLLGFEIHPPALLMIV
jgi:hypothetical protein